jgi:hypothetical protein
MIGWPIYGMALLWTDWFPHSLRSWFLFGGVAVFGGIMLIAWRCPACGELFGRSWSLTQCPHCRVSLVENASQAV